MGFWCGDERGDDAREHLAQIGPLDASSGECRLALAIVVCLGIEQLRREAREKAQALDQARCPCLFDRPAKEIERCKIDDSRPLDGPAPPGGTIPGKRVE